MTLRTKLNLALLAAALSAALAAGYFFYRFGRDEIYRVQEERIAAAAAGAERMAAEAALAGDQLMLVDYLADLRRSRPDIAATFLTWKSGAETEIRRGKPPPGAAAPGRRLTRPVAELPAEQRASGSAGAGRYAARPPTAANAALIRRASAQGAAVRLDFSADYLEKERSDLLMALWRNTAHAAALSAALAGVLAFLLSAGISRRLGRLSALAADIGAGRFGSRASIGGSDEIAAFGAAFDTMSAKLLELENMKKAFVSSVTHELRSPLGAIESRLALLERRPGAGETEKGDYRRIRENVSRLSAFVTGLLDLARIERGEMPFNPGPEDAAALARDVTDFFKPRAADLGLRLEYSGEESLPAGLDRELAAHMLTNFLANALKFTPKGGSVEVKVLRREGSLVFEVADTGPGVPPGAESRLFEAFYRAPGAAAGGTGLGLSLCRRIAGLHSGKVFYRPGARGGSVFGAEFPLNN
ncbi:MAG: two component sensor histidine kinase [Elusimicrobia bacterium]|nr:MAG: two component sensor histidine kinase [Elusimicrobiota bacterium]KAF0158375.1 MAG: two component sensor histidine kinase [Elusimicrobiota bacterium]